MREIKFMAWDIKNKKMCQVIKIYYVPDVGANEVLIQHPDSFDELLLGVDTQAVLLQYTGLKDKNGKEIYADDLCRIDGIVVRVEWLNGAFVVQYFTEPKFTYLGHFDETDVEVIGNIYQDSHLMDSILKQDI